MCKQGSKKYPTNDTIWTIVYFYINFCIKEIKSRRDSIYDSRRRLKSMGIRPMACHRLFRQRTLAG